MPIKELFALFAVSGFTCIILTLLFRSLAIKTGFVNIHSFKKLSTDKVPLMGGAAIYLSVLLVTAGCIIFVLLNSKFNFIPSLNTYFIPNLPGMLKKLKLLAAIFGGGLIIVIGGLYDDKYNIKPSSKIILQLVAASVPIIFGVRLSLFLGNTFYSYLVTYFWFLLVINSFNLLDNADGLSAGVALVSALTFIFISVRMGELFISSMLFIFAGCILGFLMFNFNPASIFMGDAGSMFLGYMLAVFTILGTYYTQESYTLFPILMPILVLAVPLYDTVTVIAVRIYKGVSIFAPDKNHFSHRLMRLGLSYKTAITFIYIICLCTGIAAIVLPEVDNTCSALLIMSQVILILFIISILEYFGSKNGKQ
ncbi:MAG: undecaprenyl/decaprenyl-phosphate alpha-N-acetylglucosaminyl 1-phosphate transferase [Candidatus Aureabacteria bacterium]|nr:undecaprenyl/decaprenyl-phosphate alpha-N-acetylglucosaminyl 1-phosphate transferase [Candidatus Auribacterota bacterium]